MPKGFSRRKWKAGNRFQRRRLYETERDAELPVPLTKPRNGTFTKEIEMQDSLHFAGPAREGRRRPQPGRRQTCTTKDGHAILVRPITPGDEERLLRTYSRLSLRTIYRRFHTPYPKVPERKVVSFTKADGYGTGGVVAVMGDEVVGHAMYVRSEDEGSEAEFAIVVEDAWQAKGVGKLLLSELTREAMRHGIEAFTGIVLAENRPILGVINSVFAGAKRTLRSNLYHVCVPVVSAKPLTNLEPHTVTVTAP
jgi:GNAT superfamily N-acetyltransferase